MNSKASSSWLTSFLLLMLLCKCSSLSVNKTTDELSLLALKDQIQGGLSSWNQSVHFCQWQGIKCSKLHHDKIISLNLSSQGLLGSISPHIGNFSFLRVLDLGDNKFHGPIPPEIGQLFRLQHLNLRNNSFTGKIPMNLTQCRDLNLIYLGENSLIGSIPAEFGSFQKLTSLYLGTNHLSGQIPASFGNLSYLDYLDIGSNTLEGNIPETLGRLSKLTTFIVEYNALSGQVPSLIYNISSITEFSIIKNNLSGSLPPNLGNTLPNLAIFWASGNRFSGPFPRSLNNATMLVLFDVLDNFLTGKVLSELGALKNLEQFSISNNQLGTGESGDLSFITSLTNATNLNSMSISYNNFGGALPVSVSNLSSLVELYAGHNPIVGTIPQAIGDLPNLIVLGLETAKFEGSIPSSIGKMKLQRLILSENKLTGPIPASLANITSLYELELNDNRLEGSIPLEFGGHKFLNLLDISDNNLNGTIPRQIFDIFSLRNLSLSSNFLTGSLPIEVGNLKNLQLLNVSGNKLSGKIPSTLGSCISIEVLSLENNLFEGSIPQSLTSLKVVREIDASSNNLSGEIPKYFGDFQYLERLNLSFNDLEGEVPKNGIFQNANAVSVEGNIKLCGGSKELNLLACRLDHSTKKRSLGSILAISLAVSFCVLGLIIFLIIYMKKKPQNTSSPNSSRSPYLKVSYGELLQATGGFSPDSLIGEGSFGRVYKGMLDEGRLIVAVKVFKLQQRGSLKTFNAECESLRSIRHRNLVKIITSCSSTDFQGNDFKALVFEFMPNGNVETWLHPVGDREENQPRNLNLLQRLNIVIDVASALNYLHHQCHISIIHRDLKPSNVLLDDDMVAHVSDFGLAKLLPGSAENLNGNQSTSLGVKGSIGYVPPEYGMGGAATTQGDVYSYGILVLELFTGRRPTDEMFAEGWDIHNFVRTALPDQVHEIVDPLLISQEREEEEEQAMLTCIASILRIGIVCSAQTPGERKDMEEVDNELHSIKEQYKAFLDALKQEV
ncbi:uncharacterized protein LOC141678179 [Apium graveolens]|uniref:uncharacterized protein LOC141678179 n=1 Tax=Apium graveolens TaxID=4045 RepID=UPI003D79DF2C